MKEARRLTVTLDDLLEQAIEEAPLRLHLDRDASASERLREYARRGYEATLEEERLATYRRWAEVPEIAADARAASGRAAARGVFED